MTDYIYRYKQTVIDALAKEGLITAMVIVDRLPPAQPERTETQIDNVIQKLEYILEGDPRTFSNPECEYGWVFNRVNEAIKMLKEIEKDMPSVQSER